jgi:acetyl-CoA/propionyl-CoA carboxylase, biotin carboxylase, biotin carboxyl carrier protein
VFSKVLIANRGEIAVRVIRACRELGIKTVAVYSELDRDALHVRLADEAYALGGQTAAESYLNTERHPRRHRAQRRRGGAPRLRVLLRERRLRPGHHRRGRGLHRPATGRHRGHGRQDLRPQGGRGVGVAGVPGTTEFITSPDQVRAFGAEHGYPIAIKAAYGGGGRGMKVVRDEDAIEEAIESAQRESKAYFGRDEIYMERYLTKPRHVEVQVLADTHGNCVYLGTRDCSAQRRHQKLIEEAPAPGIDPRTSCGPWARRR